jgi:HNH endonuclease
MSRPGKPGRFKVSQPAPLAVSAQKSMKIGRFRGNPADRGYDAKWTGISLRYRKLNPFCAWCDQDGRVTLADLVDHIIPVRDRPDLVHDWKNIWSLCTHCHGRKYALEEWARTHDQIELLPLWVKNPETRPPQFRCEAVR